jgi:hypothetical protein
MAKFDEVRDIDAPLEEGTYILTVVDIADGEANQFGDSLKWIFHVANPASPEEPILGTDGKPYEYWQFSSPKMTPRAKARRWVEALLGRPLDAGTRPNPTALLGRRMVATVVHEEDDEGNLRARIPSNSKPKGFGPSAAASANGAAGDALGGPALKDAWRKAINKAILADIEGAEDLKAGVDLEAVSEPVLRRMLADLQASMAVAAA